MSLDRVKPLKLESTDSGGNQDDLYPTSLNPEEDHIECAGIVLDDPGLIDESTVLWRDTNDMKFKDTHNPDGHTLTELANVNDSQHEILPTLVHEIDATTYDEITYSGNDVSSYIVWTNSGKTQKVREELYTFDIGHKVTQVVTKQYDGTGVVKMTMTENYTYSGSKVSTVTRMKS